MSRAIDVPTPVLKITSYDRAVAGVVAAVLCLAVVCAGVSAIWISTRAPAPSKAVPVELVELPGGYEDGSPDETLRVDGPGPETPDASPADEVSEELEIAQSLDSVTSNSETGAEPTQRTFETGLKNTGKRGKASGTGRRALGSGGGPGRGFPREQRWFVRFGDESDLDEYARQLDFFKIELGALLPGGELVYLSSTSQIPANIRRIKTGKDEARLYMTWVGGQRRFADTQLFARSGINVASEVPMFHFYPPEVEAQLARLERDYRGRPVEQIKRTYFAVTRGGGGYQFEVVRQLFLD